MLWTRFEVPVELEAMRERVDDICQAVFTNENDILHEAMIEVLPTTSDEIKFVIIRELTELLYTLVVPNTPRSNEAGDEFHHIIDSHWNFLWGRYNHPDYLAEVAKYRQGRPSIFTY
jgi:hypothetical protein